MAPSIAAPIQQEFSPALKKPWYTTAMPHSHNNPVNTIDLTFRIEVSPAVEGLLSRWLMLFENDPVLQGELAALRERLKQSNQNMKDAVEASQL